MDTKTTDSLLGLLVMTIFADKHVYATEIFAFVKVAQTLQDKGLIPKEMSEAKLLLWYEMHKERLYEKVATHDLESWLQDCLNDLDHLDEKADILAAMTNIAKSDDELHISEVALHVLAAKIWKIDYVAPKILAHSAPIVEELIVI